MDEHEAIGTGLGAAMSSFCFFASGAVIPVLPYLFGLQGLTAVVVAAVLVGLALLATGAAVGLLSGGLAAPAWAPPAGDRLWRLQPSPIWWACCWGPGPGPASGGPRGRMGP